MSLKLQRLPRVSLPCVMCWLLLSSVSLAQENNSFAAKQICSTKAFQFEIPKPWYYAAPDVTQEKNKARCFLNSRLRLRAEGMFLVDAGKATSSIEKTVENMTRVMKGGRNEIEVQRDEFRLAEDQAVCLKSDVADYNTPCAVIVHEHDGTLYLIMMSVSEKTHLKQRDLMLQSLAKTWRWKQAGDDK